MEFSWARGSSFASRAVLTSAPTLDFRLRESAHIKHLRNFGSLNLHSCEFNPPKFTALLSSVSASIRTGCFLSYKQLITAVVGMHGCFSWGGTLTLKNFRWLETWKNWIVKYTSDLNATKNKPTFLIIIIITCKLHAKFHSTTKIFSFGQKQAFLWYKLLARLGRKSMNGKEHWNSILKF